MEQLMEQQAEQTGNGKWVGVRPRLKPKELRALIDGHTPHPSYLMGVAEAAKLIDGEGTIGLRASSVVPKAVMSVAQNHPGYPVQLYRMFGGGVYEGNGHSSVPYVYEWRLQRLDLLTAAITSLMPFLWEKRPAAVLVLRFLDARRKMPRSISPEHLATLNEFTAESYKLHKTRTPLVEDWLDQTRTSRTRWAN